MEYIYVYPYHPKCEYFVFLRIFRPQQFAPSTIWAPSYANHLFIWNISKPNIIWTLRQASRESSKQKKSAERSEATKIHFPMEWSSGFNYMDRAVDHFTFTSLKGFNKWFEISISQKWYKTVSNLLPVTKYYLKTKKSQAYIYNSMSYVDV